MSENNKEKEEIFKSGVGSGQDLKPLTEYDNKLEEFFTAEVGLTARKESEDDYYPAVKVDYSLQPKIMKMIPNHEDVPYNINVTGYPNYNANYYLSIVGSDNHLVKPEDGEEYQEFFNENKLDLDELEDLLEEEEFEYLKANEEKLEEKLEEICPSDLEEMSEEERAEKLYEATIDKINPEENRTIEDDEYEDVINREKSMYAKYIEEKNTRTETIEDNVTPYREYKRDYYDYEGYYTDGKGLVEGDSEGFGPLNPKITFDLQDFLEIPYDINFEYEIYPRIGFGFKVKNTYGTSAHYDYNADQSGNTITLTLSPPVYRDQSKGYSTISKLDQPDNGDPNSNIDYHELDSTEYDFGIRKILENTHDQMKTRLWWPSIEPLDWSRTFEGDEGERRSDISISWGSCSTSSDNSKIETSSSNDRLTIHANQLFSDIVNPFSGEDTTITFPWARTWNNNNYRYDLSSVEEGGEDDDWEKKQTVTIQTIHCNEDAEDFSDRDFEVEGDGMDRFLSSGIDMGSEGSSFDTSSIVTAVAVGALAAVLFSTGIGAIVGAVVLAFFGKGDPPPDPLVGLRVRVTCYSSDLEITDIKVNADIEEKGIKLLYNDDINKVDSLNNDESYIGLLFGKDLKKHDKFNSVISNDNYDDYDIFAVTNYSETDELSKDDVRKNRNTTLSDLSSREIDRLFPIPDLEEFGISSSLLNYPKLGDDEENKISSNLVSNNLESRDQDENINNLAYPNTIFLPDATIDRVKDSECEKYRNKRNYNVEWLLGVDSLNDQDKVNPYYCIENYDDNTNRKCSTHRALFDIRYKYNTEDRFREFQKPVTKYNCNSLELAPEEGFQVFDKKDNVIRKILRTSRHKVNGNSSNCTVMLQSYGITFFNISPVNRDSTLRQIVGSPVALGWKNQDGEYIREENIKIKKLELENYHKHLLYNEGSNIKYGESDVYIRNNNLYVLDNKKIESEFKNIVYNKVIEFKNLNPSNFKLKEEEEKIHFYKNDYPLKYNNKKVYAKKIDEDEVDEKVYLYYMEDDEEKSVKFNDENVYIYNGNHLRIDEERISSTKEDKFFAYKKEISYEEFDYSNFEIYKDNNKAYLYYKKEDNRLKYKDYDIYYKIKKDTCIDLSRYGKEIRLSTLNVIDPDSDGTTYETEIENRDKRIVRIIDDIGDLEKVNIEGYKEKDNEQEKVSSTVYLQDNELTLYCPDNTAIIGDLNVYGRVEYPSITERQVAISPIWYRDGILTHTEDHPRMLFTVESQIEQNNTKRKRMVNDSVNEEYSIEFSNNQRVHECNYESDFYPDRPLCIDSKEIRETKNQKEKESISLLHEDYMDYADFDAELFERVRLDEDSDRIYLEHKESEELLRTFRDMKLKELDDIEKELKTFNKVKLTEFNFSNFKVTQDENKKYICKNDKDNKLKYNNKPIYYKDNEDKKYLYYKDEEEKELTIDLEFKDKYENPIKKLYIKDSKVCVEDEDRLYKDVFDERYQHFLDVDGVYLEPIKLIYSGYKINLTEFKNQNFLYVATPNPNGDRHERKYYLSYKEPENILTYEGNRVYTIDNVRSDSNKRYLYYDRNDKVQQNISYKGSSLYFRHLQDSYKGLYLEQESQKVYLKENELDEDKVYMYHGEKNLKYDDQDVYIDFSEEKELEHNFKQGEDQGWVAVNHLINNAKDKEKSVPFLEKNVDAEKDLTSYFKDSLPIHIRTRYQNYDLYHSESENNFTLNPIRFSCIINDNDGKKENFIGDIEINEIEIKEKDIEEHNPISQEFSIKTIQGDNDNESPTQTEEVVYPSLVKPDSFEYEVQIDNVELIDESEEIESWQQNQGNITGDILLNNTSIRLKNYEKNSSSLKQRRKSHKIRGKLNEDEEVGNVRNSKMGQRDDVLNNQVTVECDYKAFTLGTETVTSTDTISYPNNPYGYIGYPVEEISDKYFGVAYSDLEWEADLPTAEYFEFDTDEEVTGPYEYWVDSSNKNVVFSIDQDGDNENEDSTHTIRARRQDSIIWRPFIHTGYFYLHNNNDDINDLIQEHYLYNQVGLEAIAESDNGNGEVLIDDPCTTNITPQQTAPVIIKARNSDDEPEKIDLKRVMFFDDHGEMTLTNKEKIKVMKEQGQPYIQTTYKTPKKSSIKAYKENKELKVDKVEKNKVYFKNNNLEKRDKVEISYMVNNSFLMRQKYNPEIGDFQTIFRFSNSYKQFLVYYEQDSFSPFYELNNVDINPAVNDITNGFIYITNEENDTHMLDSYLPRKTLSIDEQEFMFVIKLLDEKGNPIFNEYKDKDIELTSKNGLADIKIINNRDEINQKDNQSLLGLAVTAQDEEDGLSNFSSLPDQTGNVYFKYTLKDNIDEIIEELNEETIRDTIEVKIEEDNFMTELHLLFHEPNRKERFAKLNIDNNVIVESEEKYIEAKVLDENYNPINDVSIEFDIGGYKTTKEVDSQGRAGIYFDYDKIQEEKDLNVYDINEGEKVMFIEAKILDLDIDVRKHNDKKKVMVYDIDL